MNNKAKGTRNEHRCMRDLEGCGYSCTRSAASLGEFDVIAIGPMTCQVVRCIQVKTNRWPCKKEMEGLELFAVAHPHVQVEVWRWDDRQRDPKVRVL